MTSNLENQSSEDGSAELESVAVPRLSTTVIPFLRSHSLWVLSLSVAYWILLFVLTHLPNDKLPGHDIIGDKIAHAAAYCGLTWLLTLNCRLRSRMSAWTAVGIVLVAALYGAVDEITQQFARGRTTDPYDWLADIVGAILGVAILEAMNAMRPWLRCMVARWIRRHPSAVTHRPSAAQGRSSEFS